MILRLKGADFSGNNIGTLSTWQIYKNLKGFATESAISSVEKDASYSATFYVKDGYTFSTATVTMGGTDITSSLVWNNTYTEATLTIAKVTGNVQINITGVIAGGTYYTVNYTYSQLGTTDAIQNGTTRTVSAGTVITESDFPVLDEYYYQRMIIMPGQEVVESVTVNSNINIQWEYAKKLLQDGNVYIGKALNADGSLVENSLYDTFYDLVDVESNTTYTILKGYDSNTESYVSVDECVALIYERIQDLNSAESSTFKQLTLDENNCFTTSSHSYDSYEHTICVVVYTGKEIPLIVKGEATLNNLDKEEGEGGFVEKHLFILSPTPSDATVTLTASGYTQIGNTITVPGGTSVAWTVSATGYVTQSGTHIVTQQETKYVTLVEESGGGYDSVDMWVSQTISSSGVISTTGLNQSNIMLKEPTSDSLTITAIDESLLIAQVTYNDDGSFKARGSWVTINAGENSTFTDANPYNLVIATKATGTSYSVEQMLAKMTVTVE